MPFRPKLRPSSTRIRSNTGQYNGINGQKPTFYDTNNAAWTGNGGFLFTNQANTALLTSNSGDGSAYIPLTLAPNTSYSYSLTLSPSIAETSWQEMGFINTAGASESAFSANIGPSLIFGLGAGPQGNRSTVDGIQLFNGAVGTNPINVTTPLDAQLNNPQTFTFTLNTGATLGAYTYSVTDTESDGVTVDTLASNVSYTGTINGVELGTFYQGGEMSNMIVTSMPIETPEPSTTCLFLAGALGLFFLQRRVRAS